MNTFPVNDVDGHHHLQAGLPHHHEAVLSRGYQLLINKHIRF